MNGQQTTGNAGAGADLSADEARLKEAMKQLKLLHVKVSCSKRRAAARLLIKLAWQVAPSQRHHPEDAGPSCSEPAVS